MNLTTAEAAQRLGVTSGVVTKMAKEGLIPCKIVSKRNAIRQRRVYTVGDIKDFARVYRKKHHYKSYGKVSVAMAPAIKPKLNKTLTSGTNGVKVVTAPATGILTQIKHMESRINKLESRLQHIDETVTKLLQIWS